jgi:hypothetical protein
MRRKAWMVGLGSASIALSSLCGCSWEEIFPSNVHTLPNAVAVDRALRLCSLSEGDQPFHLVLEISPPAHPTGSSRGPSSRGPNSRESDPRVQNLRAHVEVFWLNAITYRTEIRSQSFNQIRIVNGSVVEEHDTGDFYPRWIQNFVDAILNPVPHAARLAKVPGKVPVGTSSHACISTSAPDNGPTDETATAQVCFQDAEPRLASGVEFTRSVWFDDFAPFGQQQIARTLVNDLPANVLVQGQVTLLESLPNADYPLLRAKEFTLLSKRIQTALVSKTLAQYLLETAAGQSWRQVDLGPTDKQTGAQMTVYIRTDRTGRVREAYRDKSDQFGLQDAAVARALTLKFKPLIVDGAARQMEAPLAMPSKAALAPSLPIAPRR